MRRTKQSFKNKERKLYQYHNEIRPKLYDLSEDLMLTVCVAEKFS